MKCDYDYCQEDALFSVNRWHLDLWRSGYLVCEAHKKEIVEFIDRNHDRAAVCLIQNT